MTSVLLEGETSTYRFLIIWELQNCAFLSSIRYLQILFSDRNLLLSFYLVETSYSPLPFWDEFWSLSISPCRTMSLCILNSSKLWSSLAPSIVSVRCLSFLRGVAWRVHSHCCLLKAIKYYHWQSLDILLAIPSSLVITIFSFLLVPNTAIFRLDEIPLSFVSCCNEGGHHSCYMLTVLGYSSCVLLHSYFSNNEGPWILRLLLDFI